MPLTSTETCELLPALALHPRGLIGSPDKWLGQAVSPGSVAWLIRGRVRAPDFFELALEISQPQNATFCRLVCHSL